MSNEVKKIMGMTLVVPEDLDSLEVNGAINYANEKYAQAIQEDTSTADSNRHRALAILKIVMELQAIKGNQDVFLDKCNKRVNDLIKMIDSLGISE